MAAEDQPMESIDDAVKRFKSEVGLELSEERLDLLHADGTNFLLNGEYYGTLIIELGDDGLLKSAAYRGKHEKPPHTKTVILGIDRIGEGRQDIAQPHYGRQDSHEFVFLGVSPGELVGPGTAYNLLMVLEDTPNKS